MGARENTRVPISRIAWLLTVVACLITAGLLFLANYVGYGFVAVAIAGAAAINLR